ncbi:hypothetical protein Ciccas_000428 [Cichlidogyrus casuarinus]|uniref:S phase cyclin A-associated protein in the endoplasmic reticulum N-terminal domain-containing protein n=1 Tax=Cichlidogyrus casuarinus TaxID=1844966 RepID=A0ABD2QP40_9PLAT
MGDDSDEDVSDNQSTCTFSSGSLLNNKKDDYKALFWGQLVDTLRRTIDQLYSACEADKSKKECKEIIMFLSYSIRDFQSLIEKLDILKDGSISQKRPLAWDERKMSIESSFCLLSPYRSPRNTSIASTSFPIDLNNKNVQTLTNKSNFYSMDYDENLTYYNNSDSEDTAATPANPESIDQMIMQFNNLEQNLLAKLSKTRSIKDQLAKRSEKENSLCSSINFEEDFEEYEDFSHNLKEKLLQQSFCNQHNFLDYSQLQSNSEDNPSSICASTNGSIRLCSNHFNHLCLLCSLTTGFCCHADRQVTPSTIKSRVPGRTVDIHEKLLSRQKCPNSSRKDLEAKQERADQLRKKHLGERTLKLQDLRRKVEQAQHQKRNLCSKRRSQLHSRLSAAEANRRAQLDRIVHKAHDEETKGREIAFIQSLEAEQKQHSIQQKHEESQARLLERDEKRRQRLEKKQELEEAAKLRRCQMETQRRAKLALRIEKWKSQTDTAFTKSAFLKQQAMEKKQYRMERIAFFEAQQKTNYEELRSKIEHKHLNSERRHQEQLREISKKAFQKSVLDYSNDCASRDANDNHLDESGASSARPLPAREQYAQRKWCRACQVMIESDLSLNSHLQGWRHKNAVRNAFNRDYCLTDLVSFCHPHFTTLAPIQSEPFGRCRSQSNEFPHSSLRQSARSHEAAHQKTATKDAQAVSTRINYCA